MSPKTNPVVQEQRMHEEFSDLDRRTIANLAIPRHVDDLTQTLREDQHTGTRASDDVNEHLLDLEARGLVVKLGDGHGYDSSSLASAAQKNKHTIPMADEQCEIMERRWAAPHLNWRLPGDHWMLSVDGLEQIKAPIENEPAAFDDARLASVIQEEWARTRKGVKRGKEADKKGLSGALTEDEFLDWLKTVQTEWKDRTGRKDLPVPLKGPLAGGSQFSDAYEIILLDAENQKASITAAAPWYMALSILAFNDADTGTTADDGSHIPTYTGYARKSVAAADMNAGSGTSGSVTNANAIIFAACTSGSSAIVAFAHTSAATVGTLRKFGTCSSTTVSTTQTPAQFAAGAYTTTIA